MLDNMAADTKALASVVSHLTEHEERTAIDAAMASLRPDLSDRYRVIGTELRIDKRPDDQVPDRVIGVYVVDYHKHRSFEVLVVSKGTVIAVNDLPPYQLPISRDELQEAQSIAVQNEHLARAVRRHEAAFVSPFVPHDHSRKKRIIGLHYFRPDKRHPQSPRPIGDVEVDLGAGTAVFIPIEVEGE
jgi:hypothetical protein